ncbi:hypothetical protein MTO96_011492 [Rhipicephalus appendiculatus]
MVFHKIWRCKESKRERSSGKPAAHCPAKIDLKIKKVNRNTKRNDAFLRGERPLPAVIKPLHHNNHSHSTAAADALSRLTPTLQTKQTFLAYFDNDMSPAEAIRLHESKLLVQEDGYALVANSAVNPLPPAIYYWHRLWREQNFGKNVDPLLKITEKMPLYAKHALAIHDRHELGKLALGDACPSIEFFANSRDTINAQGEQHEHDAVPQDETPAATLPQDEQRPDSEPIPATEPCASTSHLEQQDSEDAANNLEALFEQLRQIHAEEKGNAAYRRHLLSGTKRLRRLQEQKRGVGAMMAMDAALGLELRRGRYIKVQPTAISRRRPGLTRGSKRVAAGRPPSGPSPKRAKKRRHVLQHSVSQNIPHAKLHGYGH